MWLLDVHLTAIYGKFVNLVPIVINIEQTVTKHLAFEMRSPSKTTDL